MIAPRFEDGALGVLDVSEPAGVSEVIEEAVEDGDAVVDGSVDKMVVEEGGDVVVDGSVDKTVVDSDKVDVEEVVVVLGTLGNKPMTPAVVNESVSSGQMPVVHGSLEQHPRKLPAVQTYHRDQASFTESEGNLVKSRDTAVMLDSTSLNDWKREVSSFQRDLKIFQQK
ncbi:unnamed protein product [Penicillium palitans]